MSCRAFLQAAVVSALVLSVASGCGSGGSPSGGGSGGGGGSTVTLTVAGGAYAAGTVGVAYQQAIGVSGGTAPYSCKLASGSAPTGIVLNSNCTFSGTPSVAGTGSVTVTASDSASTTHTGSATISITVAPAPLAITTTSLASGAVGILYSGAVTVTGGTTPYSCAVASGNADGLSFANGCTLSGLPTAAGNFSISVKATDAGNPAQTATGTITFTVSAAPSLRVLAGTEAVIGASVQVYAAGTTGNGSAPKALLTTPATTDSFGGFTLPASAYTCPTATSIVYVTATGGKVGSATAVTHPGLLLMSSPGTCAQLQTTSAMVIDEVSTVAGAYAFQQFLTAGGKMGATATNLSGLTLAAGTFANLANSATGTSPGASFPANGTAQADKINLLANVMNACLVAASPTGSACSSFYSAATVNGAAPTNTLDTVLNLASNPGLDTTAIFNLATGLTAYLPQSTDQPTDWLLRVDYTGGGMNLPAAVTIDSTGRVWVASYSSAASLFNNNGSPVFANGLTGNGLLNSYGAAVDAKDNYWQASEQGGPTNLGTVGVFTPTGAVAAGSPYTAGGLNFPIAVAHDTGGTAWVVDYGNSHLTLLANNGTPLSGTDGYTTKAFVFPVAVAVDGKKRGWVGNSTANTVVQVAADGSSFVSYTVGSGPSGIAVDANNNIWTANYYGDTIGLISSTGIVVTGDNGIAGGGVLHPVGIAIDGAGKAWVANYRRKGISVLQAANSANPAVALSGAQGWGADSNLLEAFGIAIDQGGNVWVSSFGNNLLTEFIGAAVPVKTPMIGPVVLP